MRARLMFVPPKKPELSFWNSTSMVTDRVLVEKRAGLHHDAFAGLELALEDVAVAVQHKQARTAGGDEAVHEHALAAEQNVGQALDAHERVVDLVRAEQKGVLAHVQLHAGMQRQHHQFAGGVAREGDAARTRWPR